MSAAVFEIQTPEGALLWMLNQNMIVTSSTKDPETLATIRGYLLSESLQEKIGSNLVRLFAKATSRGNGGMGKVTVRDAFLTATIGAVLEVGQVSLSEEEMMRCANIILAFLPMERLEKAGIAKKPLRSLAHDRFLVGKIRRIVG
jgi:hypothetical protein